MRYAGGRIVRFLFVAIIATASLGCTHRQLTRSMVNQASTVMAIEHQMILDNIAMFTVNPDLLPWHVKIKDGTVQINDQAGMPELGVQWGGTPGFTRGVKVTRSVTEQWGADAVTDPRRVKKLQDVYRRAVGLAPQPDPAFLKAFAAFQKAHMHDQAQRRRGQQLRRRGRTAARATEAELGLSIATDSSTKDAAAAGAEGQDKRPMDVATIVAELEAGVPTGWFYLGCKKDVPKNACFVGHYCDRYVWVMPDGVESLSQFTLIVLALTELSPHETGDSSHGLVFTRERVAQSTRPIARVALARSRANGNGRRRRYNRLTASIVRSYLAISPPAMKPQPLSPSPASVPGRAPTAGCGGARGPVVCGRVRLRLCVHRAAERHGVDSRRRIHDGHRLDSWVGLMKSRRIACAWRHSGSISRKSPTQSSKNSSPPAATKPPPSGCLSWKRSWPRCRPARRRRPPRRWCQARWFSSRRRAKSTCKIIHNGGAGRPGPTGGIRKDRIAQLPSGWIIPWCMSRGRT